MKKFYSFLVTMLLSVAAFAYDAEIDGIYYNLNTENKTAEVTFQYEWSSNNYSGATSIIIPEKVTYNAVEYSVTSIGGYAFFDCSSLSSITIPNSVTSIGGSAFSDCSSLTSITIPNSVTSIGNSIFYECSSLTSVQWNVTKCNDFNYDSRPFNGCEQITSFTFGDNVEHIPAYLCYGMSKLTSITIPNSVTSIGYYAFMGCSSLTSVQWNAKKCSDFSSGTVPFNSSVTSFTLGDNVERIPSYLGLSGLKSITIPESVTSIGSCVFGLYSSELTSVYISDIAAWCNIEFDGSYSNPLAHVENLYLNNTKVTDLVIPEGVDSIKDYVFYSCSFLTSITLPNSVISIGNGAFRGCPLTSITLPNSVISIGNGAFRGCPLTSITLPNSVTEFGDAFSYCTSLTSIDISNSVTKIDYGAFACCSLLTSITIPNSVTSILSEAFYQCSSLTSIKIPNSVTEIGRGSFWGCSGLTAIEIPNSVIYLGDEAFANCPALRYVKLGNGFRTNNYEDEEESYLGRRLFYCEEDYFYDEEKDESVWLNSSLDTLICEFRDCNFGEEGSDYDDNGRLKHSLVGTKNLRYFEGPAKLVNSIKEETQTQFSNKLTEVHITNGELDENGFNFINRSKKSLHTIDLAGTANTTINDLAFYDCYKLENLMLPDNLEIIGYKAFADCKHLTKLTIPASVTEIGESAFENCRSIDAINFAEGGKLETIGSWAFYNNHNLTEVTIPEGVKTIGDAAFYGCTYLENITLPSTIQSIGDNGFALCNKVKRMEVKAEIPPVIEAKTFYEVSRDIEFIVPEEARNAYAEHEYWKEFIQSAPDNVENVFENINIYTQNGVLYFEGLNVDYQVFDTNGRLVYSGRDTQLQLPRGVYVITVGGEVEKIVL